MNDVISLRVFMILTEMGLAWPISFQMEDFASRHCETGHLYEIRLIIRDDVDSTDFVEAFCAAMEAYNQISQVKAGFRELLEFPGPVKNAHTVYLTVESH